MSCCPNDILNLDCTQVCLLRSSGEHAASSEIQGHSAASGFLGVSAARSLPEADVSTKDMPQLVESALYRKDYGPTILPL